MKKCKGKIAQSMDGSHVFCVKCQEGIYIGDVISAAFKGTHKSLPVFKGHEDWGNRLGK